MKAKIIASVFVCLLLAWIGWFSLQWTNLLPAHWVDAAGAWAELSFIAETVFAAYGLWLITYYILKWVWK